MREDLQVSKDAAQKAQFDLRKEEDQLNVVKAESSDTSGFVAKCSQFTDDLTGKMVEEINKLLLSDKPELLIMGIEPFVAVLRNKMDADNVDVELFFKKHANLVAKMRRMEMRDMQQNVVESKLQAISPLIQQWEATERTEQDISEYSVLLKWAKAFCEGAQIELKLKNQEEAVEQARKAQITANADYSTKERQVNEIENNRFVEFYDDALAAIEDRLAKVEELIDHDRTQAEKVQETFNNYDRKYFDQYITLSNNLTGKVS